MNRTLRNGLAVAGMAGGIFFLGQAVASAADGDLSQDNSAPISQSQGAPGSNSADVDQSNNLHLDADAAAGNAGVGVGITNDVGDNTVNGPGGSADKPTGTSDRKPEPPKPAPTTVRVSFDTTITNDVNVDSSVVHSGNAVIASPKVTQTNSAPVTQSTPSQDKRREGDHGNDGRNTLNGPMGGHGGGNDADVDQHNTARVDLDANAGDVGVDVGIENNVGGNTVNCWGGDKSSVTCDVSFNTTINNNVDIRSIICGSGNAVIGTLPSFVCNLTPESTPPAPAPAGAPAAQVKPAGNTVKHAASAPKVSSASSKKNELAFTGAETSLPLTLGLLALGAGGALTLAGRRRQTATV